MTKESKVSIPSIVDPMLLAGGKTRQEVMDEIRKQRPDFKAPGAAVSNRFRALTEAGKYPCLVQPIRHAKPKKEKVARRLKDHRGYAAKLKSDPAKLEAWRQFLHKPFRAVTPEIQVKLRRIWP